MQLHEILYQHQFYGYTEYIHTLLSASIAGCGYTLLDVTVYNHSFYIVSMRKLYMIDSLTICLTYE